MYFLLSLNPIEDSAVRLLHLFSFSQNRDRFLDIDFHISIYSEDLIKL